MVVAVRSDRPMGRFDGAMVALIPLSSLQPDMDDPSLPAGSQAALTDAELLAIFLRTGVAAGAERRDGLSRAWFDLTGSAAIDTGWRWASLKVACRMAARTFSSSRYFSSVRTSASAALSRSASGMMIMWFLAPPKHCTRLPAAQPARHPLADHHQGLERERHRADGEGNRRGQAGRVGYAQRLRIADHPVVRSRI